MCCVQGWTSVLNYRENKGKIEQKLIRKACKVVPVLLITGALAAGDAHIEESEEISGKDRANIIKRQRRYQELQKEIEDMRKAIF